MAKDARGHGSDARGGLVAHQDAMDQAARSGRIKVQLLDLRPTTIGPPWQTVRRYDRTAVAERVAQSLRADWRNKDKLVRIRGSR